MMSQSGERTLISEIIPKHSGTVNSCVTFAAENTLELVQLATSCFSIPFDFFIKSSGKSNLGWTFAE
jgi:hypothetical protein